MAKMPTATVIGAGTLTLGEISSITAMDHQVTSVVLKPSAKQSESRRVLSGGEIAGDREESFKLEGKIVQDFGNPESLTEWLFNHRGEEMSFTFTPNSAKKKTVKGRLIVEAIDIGGDVNSKPESPFSFALVGPPAIVNI